MNPTTLATTSNRQVEVQSPNKVLRNTFTLLSMTLLFSAFTAGISMVFNLPHPGILITLLGYFGLLFAVSHYRNSSIGLLLVFALTGFMGDTQGPILISYMAKANGAQMVMMAMAGTAAIFFGLAGYAMVSRKDFSYLGSFLMVGILVGFLAALAAVFFAMPALSLAVSTMFILLMSGLILYETSNIIHGGETNYIMATVTLFVAIFNLFTSLLHLLGFMNNE